MVGKPSIYFYRLITSWWDRIVVEKSSWKFFLSEFQLVCQLYNNFNNVGSQTFATTKKRKGFCLLCNESNTKRIVGERDSFLINCNPPGPQPNFPSALKWVSVSKYEWVCMSMREYEQVWVSMSKYEQVWVSISKYEQVWASMSEYKQVWVSMSEYEWV
jgi:hypothetical protein